MVAAELPGDAYDGLAASAGLNQERSTAMLSVPGEQRRLAKEHVVESYAALKALAACPESNADSAHNACDFSGIAVIVRCNGNTLDANQAGRFFYGSGSGSSLKVHGCTLIAGESGGQVSDKIFLM